MDVYERVINLCKQKGIAATALEKELGFGRGSIGKMRTSAMSNERLKKIADYFGVSVDYLTTGEMTEGYYLDNETAKIAQEIVESKEMTMLFRAARDASPEDLKTTYQMLLALKRKEQHDDPC